MKDILKTQINTGLVPVQGALAQGWNATASHLPTQSNTPPYLAQPEGEEQAERVGDVDIENVQGVCSTTSNSSMTSLLAALQAFEHCPDYRTAPQAVQTLSQALVQQLRIALRDAPLTSQSHTTVQPQSE